MEWIVWITWWIIYSVSDIQDYFEDILKRHETVTDNPSIRTYLNKIKDIITFDRKLSRNLPPETMKLLESIKCKITIDENGENVPHLEYYFILKNKIFNQNVLYSYKRFNSEFDILKYGLLINFLNHLRLKIKWTSL